VEVEGGRFPDLGMEPRRVDVTWYATSRPFIEAWAPSTSAMALPQTLRSSVTPPELELVASQQLIEIVPLISMEKTAFISVQFLVNQPVQDWLI
jgi:hypothetical protein